MRSRPLLDSNFSAITEARFGPSYSGYSTFTGKLKRMRSGLVDGKRAAPFQVGEVRLRQGLRSLGVSFLFCEIRIKTTRNVRKSTICANWLCGVLNYRPLYIYIYKSALSVSPGGEVKPWPAGYAVANHMRTRGAFDKDLVLLPGRVIVGPRGFHVQVCSVICLPRALLRLRLPASSPEASSYMRHNGPACREESFRLNQYCYRW